MKAGDKLGRYLIEGRLGEGGMGSVYKAHDPTLQRTVALKVLGGVAGATDASEEGEARLLREARAAASFQHDGVVAIYDVGDADGRRYIAMEHVVGRTLKEFVGVASPGVPERLRWLTDVARALGAAHAAGLVHRDIKPANVMLRDDGAVKVLDFGVARRRQTGGTEEERTLDPVAAGIDPAASGPTPSAVLTVAGALVGTPAYMAPEQLQGHEVDGRCDQFSWGVMAYELLSGERPFDTPDPMKALASILRTRPRPLTGLPLGVDAAILRTLAPDPEDRFPDMQAVAAALQAGMTGPAVVVDATGQTHTHAGEAVTAPAPEARGGRWILGAMGALVLAAAAAAAVGLPGSKAPEDRPGTDNPEAAKLLERGIGRMVGGDVHRGRQDVEAALALDPDFAEARLELATVVFMDRPDEGRRHYMRVVEQRAELSEVRQKEVHALAPFFARPPDFAEAARRFEAVSLEHPEEPYLGIMVVQMQLAQGRTTDALERAERLSERFPDDARAWLQLSFTRGATGDFAGAMKSLDRCVALSPLATQCLKGRNDLFNVTGRCAEMIPGARTVLGVDPDNEAALEQLAMGLIATGAPDAALLEVYEERWRSAPEVRRAFVEAYDRWNLAIRRGDLAAAQRFARAMVPAAKATGLKPMRKLAADLLAETLHEAEKGAEVDIAAKEFAARAPAMQTHPMAVAETIEIALLRARWRSGQLDDASFQAARDKRLAPLFERAAAGKLDAAKAFDLWVGAFSWYDASEVEARRSLQALERLKVDMRTLRVVPITHARYGATLVRAGKLEEGIRELTEAVAKCKQFATPLVRQRSLVVLAEGQAGLGRTDAARRTFEEVLAPWKDADPMPATGKRAAAGLATLQVPSAPAAAAAAAGGSAQGGPPQP